MQNRLRQSIDRYILAPVDPRFAECQVGFLMPLRAAIEAAKAPSPWRVGNEVLYALCRERSTHTDEAEVIAKVWLIGRAYAAAIERRKNKSDENDDFYVKTVAPALARSAIDSWINGTEEGIANRLVEYGVPREDIVLAFHPAYKRPYTNFAVG